MIRDRIHRNFSRAISSFCDHFNNNYKPHTAGGDRDDVEADGILKPHLQRIVNQSMVLAQTAKDPAPYFTLLRLLFRAIGEHFCCVEM